MEKPKTLKNGHPITYSQGSKFFQKSNLTETMRPIVLLQKIGKILRANLERKLKTSKNGNLIPYNTGLRFFRKSHLAQTMHTMVLYNPVKNWEYP